MFREFLWMSFKLLCALRMLLLIIFISFLSFNVIYLEGLEINFSSLVACEVFVLSSDLIDIHIDNSRMTLVSIGDQINCGSYFIITFPALIIPLVDISSSLLMGLQSL